MVLNKPQDLAVFAAIFALLTVLVGIGITDINTYGADVNDTYFTSVRESSLSEKGFKGTADNSIKTVEGVNGSSGEPSEDTLLKEGFTSMVNLGQTWGIMWKELTKISEFIGIPNEYLIIIAGLLAISFVVVLYTWLRSRR